MNPSPDMAATQKRGTIHKCPSCGSQLAAFVSSCEACGHEFTDIEANRSITALTNRFEEIEREVDDKGLKGRNREKAILDKRARVIRDFPVPNSRDDLQQLMFFIQPKIVASVQPDPNIEDWRSKFLEVLNRAKNAYKNDASALAEFDRLEASLTTTVGKDLHLKAKRNPLLFALLGGVAILAIIGVVVSQLDSRKLQQCEERYAQGAEAEKARLEKIALAADQNYKSKVYPEAIATAGGMRWEFEEAACKLDENQKAKHFWDDKRTRLIAMVQTAIDADQAEKAAAVNREAAEQQAVERKVQEVARIGAEKEKAKELEKKW